MSLSEFYDARNKICIEVPGWCFAQPPLFALLNVGASVLFLARASQEITQPPLLALLINDGVGH